jgi:ATP-binding cassette subfamily B protein
MRAVKGAPRTHIDTSRLPSVQSATLVRILQYVKPYWLRATAVCACIVGAAALNLVPALFVKRIVDVAIPRGDLALLWLSCAAMIVGPLAAGVLQMAHKYGAETIGQDIMLDLRVALYRRFQNMPFSFFLRQKPGEAVSHVLNDVQGVGGVISGTLADIIQNSVVLASTIVFVFVLDWRLALLAIGFLPLFIIPTRRVGRKRKALKRSVQARLGELTGVLTETLSVSGALLIKVFGGAESEVQRFRRSAAEIKRLSLEQALVGRWFRLLLSLFETVGPAVLFAFGGWLVIRGGIPLGTLVAFVAVLKRLYSPASDLAGVHVDFVTSYAYFDRVFDVLDRTAPAPREASPQTLRRVAGQIELRDVSFAYDDAELALSGIDLTITPGMKVGIVGPSGAGKSTLLSLVMRLHDASSGSVLVDGVDVREIDEASLRSNIAVVTQETFLFHTTALENLRYGTPTATRTQVELAARCAHIHHVITALPDGYETIVGERGWRFSAGERQRLAIARAILRNPPILVLDEATSALDSASERQVQDALSPLLHGRTSLIVAHRLSTVRDADLIVVLQHGRIVEQGTHDELLDSNGLYAWLWRAQAKRDARRRVIVPVRDIQPVAEDDEESLVAVPGVYPMAARGKPDPE